MNERRLGYAAFPSPIDTLQIVFADAILVHLDFAGNDARMHAALHRRHRGWAPAPAPLPEAIAAPLEAYFGGELQALDQLPVLTGGTSFQREVWRVLATIAAGTTLTYADVAKRIGRDGRASRAIGGAVGANPISLVIPCHRVVPTGGGLGGYAGGAERKRWLLQHEGVAVAA